MAGEPKMRGVAGASVAAALFTLVTLGARASASAEEGGKACHLYRLAQFDMTTDESGRVSVPMTLNGQTANLIIDTGGYISTLTQSSVAAFGLPEYMFKGFYARYHSGETIYGGETLTHFVTVHQASLGGLKGSDLRFYVMSNEHVSADEGGLLGPDILHKFDVDFDFANGRFSLFSQDHCEGQVVYWTRSPVARVGFQEDEEHHLRVQPILDGTRVAAIIDTGAAYSVGSLDAVESYFGLDAKIAKPKLLPNSTEQDHGYRYPFKTLSFDGITINNPDLILRPDDESHTYHEFILGMDILRHLHMYVAYHERALYVTPATAQ